MADQDALVGGWRNRVTGSGYERPGDLLANPANHRLHPLVQAKALSALLDRVGWLQQVIVNLPDKMIVDGHLRVALAAQRGELQVPVDYVELAADEMALAATFFDPIGQLAQMDASALGEALGSLDLAAEDEALKALAQALAQDAGLLRETYAWIDHEDAALQAAQAEEERKAAKARKGAGDEGGSGADMFPLAIVLSFEEYGRWRKVRLDLGAKSDKETLLSLLEGRGA